MERLRTKILSDQDDQTYNLMIRDTENVSTYIILGSGSLKCTTCQIVKLDYSGLFFILDLNHCKLVLNVFGHDKNLSLFKLTSLRPGYPAMPRTLLL